MKCLLLLTIISTTAFSQKNISLSVPVITYKVETVNNWGPDKNSLEGSAISYGLVLKYSVRPSVILGTSKLNLVVGAGYQNLVFDINRPFNFDSPNQPIFYTKRYAYNNLSGSLGLKYLWLSTEKFSLESEASFGWLVTFRQTYTPTRRHGSPNPKQINHDFVQYGNLGTATVGFSRLVGRRIMIGCDFVVPFFTKWRKDEIFDDDPTVFFSAKYGFGLQIAGLLCF